MSNLYLLQTSGLFLIGRMSPLFRTRFYGLLAVCRPVVLISEPEAGSALTVAKLLTRAVKLGIPLPFASIRNRRAFLAFKPLFVQAAGITTRFFLALGGRFWLAAAGHA